MKNKTRQDMFHHLGTIPDPVLTRWRTWISAAVWYSTHWLEIKRIVLGFEGDGLLVTKAIMAVASPGVGAQLTELSRIYHVLPDLFNDLEGDDSIISNLV